MSHEPELVDFSKLCGVCHERKPCSTVSISGSGNTPNDFLKGPDFYRKVCGPCKRKIIQAVYRMEKR